MTGRRFDHIDLGVREMAAGEKFYEQLVPALAFTVQCGDDECRTYQLPGDELVEFFCFTEDRQHQPNESRIAFWRTRAPKWIDSPTSLGGPGA